MADKTLDDLMAEFAAMESTVSKDKPKEKKSETPLPKKTDADDLMAEFAALE